MGTEYYVGCKTCNLIRSLDKFYAMATVHDRREALERCDFWMKRPGDQYRATLLMGFLMEHIGHAVTAYTEHDEEALEWVEAAKEDDRDFWTTHGLAPEERGK